MAVRAPWPLVGRLPPGSRRLDLAAQGWRLPDRIGGDRCAGAALAGTVEPPAGETPSGSDCLVRRRARLRDGCRSQLPSPDGVRVSQAPGVTAEEVWLVEPVLRRVIAAGVSEGAAVDDLVQDALEHLLKARGRLAQEMMVPYGVVTARNLASSYGRRAVRTDALRPRLVDFSDPERPDEAVLRSEERAAMTAALARLPEEERLPLVAHELEGTPVAALTKDGSSAGATRVRLARSRAKLRVEYLLALRGVELPTADCRPTLLALAGGDRDGSGPRRRGGIYFGARRAPR